jgi:hypothetical protein
LEQKQATPVPIAKAVAFDKTIRDMTRPGIQQPVFLHRTLKPLEEIDFGKRLGLRVVNGFNGECEGLCGV